MFSSHLMDKLLRGPVLKHFYTFNEVRTRSDRIEGGVSTQEELYIPVNTNGNHWNFVKATMGTKTIELLNSMGLQSSSNFFLRALKGYIRQGCDGKRGCRGKAARGLAVTGRVAVHGQVRRIPLAEQRMGLRCLHDHIDVSRSSPQCFLPVQGGIHPRDSHIAKGKETSGGKDLGRGSKQRIY